MSPTASAFMCSSTVSRLRRSTGSVSVARRSSTFAHVRFGSITNAMAGSSSLVGLVPRGSPTACRRTGWCGEPVHPPSGERCRADVVDHDVPRSCGVRFPEQRRVVFSSAPGKHDQPEPGLKPTPAYRSVARVTRELIEHGVDPSKERSILRVRTGLEPRQRPIGDFVEPEFSHVGDGPSETGRRGWQRSDLGVPCSPGSAPRSRVRPRRA